MSIKRVVSDICSIVLTRDQFVNKKFDEKIRLPFRQVKHTDDIEWTAELYPNGCKSGAETHFGVLIWGSTSVETVLNVSIPMIYYTRKSTQTLIGDTTSLGLPKFIEAKRLYKIFDYYSECKIVIEVAFCFKAIPPYISTIKKQDIKQMTPPDIHFTCPNNRFVEAHSHYMSTLTPDIENRYIEDEPAEVRVIASPYDYDIVIHALHLCYGYPVGLMSTTEAVDVLKFLNGHKITKFFNLFMKHVAMNVTVDNFEHVVEYAYLATPTGSILQKKCLAVFQANAKLLKSKFYFRFINTLVRTALFDATYISVGTQTDPSVPQAYIDYSIYE